METVNKLLGVLFALTALALLLKGGGQSASTILGSLGDFNQKTFGTFLNS